MNKRHLFNFTNLVLFVFLYAVALKITEVIPTIAGFVHLHSFWEDVITAVPAGILSHYILRFIYKMIRPDLEYVVLSSQTLSPLKNW